MNGHVNLPKNSEAGRKLHIQSKWTTGENNKIYGNAEIHITPKGLFLDLKEANSIKLDEGHVMIKAKAIDKNGNSYTVQLAMKTTSKSSNKLSVFIWKGETQEGELVLEIKDQAFQGSLKIK